MRSRTHALLIAVLSVATGLFYWVGAAVLALTALRQGPKEASLIWFWTLLPALAVAWIGNEVAPLAVLSNVFVGALVLRATHSWAYALVTIIAVTVALAGITHLSNAQWLIAVEQQVQQLFSQLQASMGDSTQALIAPDKNQILSMLSLVNGLVTSVCLLAARAMQAALDKPKGFREEFHSLRLPKGLAIGLVAICLALMASGPNQVVWAYLIGIPLFVHGLGFVHCLVAKATNSRFTLIMVYVSVVFIGPVKVIIALLGFIDSWVDLRSKFAKPPQDS